MTAHHFCAQNVPFGLNKIFFRKAINIIFMNLFNPFIVENFKKKKKKGRSRKYENIGLSCTSTYWPLKHRTKFQKKTNELIPRKLAKRQAEGRADPNS